MLDSRQQCPQATCATESDGGVRHHPSRAVVQSILNQLSKLLSPELRNCAMLTKASSRQMGGSALSRPRKIPTRLRRRVSNPEPKRRCATLACCPSIACSAFEMTASEASAPYNSELRMAQIGRWKHFQSKRIDETIWFKRSLIGCVFAIFGFPFLASAESVADLSGLTVANAEALVAQQGFSLAPVLNDSAARLGTIFDQFPRPGGTPGAGGAIRVYVSKGIMLPDDIMGQPRSSAEATLQALGASVQVTTRQVVCEAEDVVISVAGLVPGERFDASIDAVTLVVSEEGSPTVPQLWLSEFGQLRGRERLDSTCLTLDYHDRIPPFPHSRDPCYTYRFSGSLDISPPAGTSVPPRSVVRVVSSGNWRREFSGGPGCGLIP